MGMVHHVQEDAMNSRTLTQYAGAIAIVAMLAGLIHLIMIVATAPEPYVEPTISKGEICIEDDVPEYVAFGTGYDELFPAGHEYGKDGEIINTDPLPDPADPAADPETHNDHPVMPWIEQSMTGQSPPVLFWPAPAYKQTLKKRSTPCTDKAKQVTEPGLLALVGAALLAAAVVK